MERRERRKAKSIGFSRPGGRLDLDDLRHRLPFYAQDIALATLGKPDSLTSREWRWGRKGSLALAIAGPKQGLWRDHEAGDGGDLFALIERFRGGDFAAAASFAADIVGGAVIKPANNPKVAIQRLDKEDDEKERTKKALRIWHESRSIRGTLAASYLTDLRTIDIEQLPDLDDTLRFHSNCAFGDERFPCLIALMRDIFTDEPTGIIRTAISTCAEKLGRKMLGRKQGAAVKLWPDAAVTTGLVVGEGLETVAAAATHVEHHSTQLQPAWALCDAGNLANLAPLPGVECLTIMTDHDNAGQRAAQTCARRRLASGAQVEILLPHKLGANFADLAAEGVAA